MAYCLLLYHWLVVFVFYYFPSFFIPEFFPKFSVPFSTPLWKTNVFCSFPFLSKWYAGPSAMAPFRGIPGMSRGAVSSNHVLSMRFLPSGQYLVHIPRFVFISLFHCHTIEPSSRHSVSVPVRLPCRYVTSWCFLPLL